MKEEEIDCLCEKQTLGYARKAEENELSRSLTSEPLLFIQSAKLGDRYLWYGDNLTQQQMLKRPVLTFEHNWKPSRHILVLTHTDKNFPELGEYLHWVVSHMRVDLRTVEEDEIIPYTPPGQGDPPFLYTFTVYAQFNVEIPQPLVGLPCLEGGENNRRNFNSEHFAILNKLESTQRVHFRV